LNWVDQAGAASGHQAGDKGDRNTHWERWTPPYSRQSQAQTSKWRSR